MSQEREAKGTRTKDSETQEGRARSKRSKTRAEVGKGKVPGGGRGTGNGRMPRHKVPASPKKSSQRERAAAPREKRVTRTHVGRRVRREKEQFGAEVGRKRKG